MLDKHTFGNYKASEDLVAILIELDNPKYIKVVSNCLRSFFTGVIELKKTEIGTETFLKMLRENRIDYIKNRKDLPISVKTRVRNIICAKHRETVREINKNK